MAVDLLTLDLLRPPHSPPEETGEPEASARLVEAQDTETVEHALRDTLPNVDHSTPPAQAAAGADVESPRAMPAVAADRRLVIDADEIVFRAGGATLTLRNEGAGVIELSAPEIRIHGENVISEASHQHTTRGEFVVSEAAMFSDLLGKLIRINGQCVKINS